MKPNFEPEFFKVEKFDQPVNRAALHDMACALVEDEMARWGSTGYVWLVAVKDAVRFVRTRWQDDDDKSIAVAWMRDVMRIVDAHAYAMAQEAWVTTYNDNMPDSDKRLVERAQHEGLHTLPSRLRDDIVMVWSFGGPFGEQAAMSRYLVTPRRTGLPLLGPRVDENDMRHMEGRMWNLLKIDEAADKRLLQRLQQIDAKLSREAKP